MGGFQGEVLSCLVSLDTLYAQLPTKRRFASITFVARGGGIRLSVDLTETMLGVLAHLQGSYMKIVALAPGIHG